MSDSDIDSGSYSSSLSSEGDEALSEESASNYEEQGHRSKEYIPKKLQLHWCEVVLEAIPLDLVALGFKQQAELPLMPSESLEELWRDIARGLSYCNENFLAKVFNDTSNPFLFRLCFTILKHPTLSYGLFIIDIEASNEYPVVPLILSSPNTPSRLLSELLEMLMPSSNNSEASIDLNRFDQIILKASEGLHKDYALASALGVKTEDTSNFNFYATLVKIKHHYKDVYFNALDSTDMDWRDFVFMHCSRSLRKIQRNFDKLYEYSEEISADSTFFKNWFEPDAIFKGEFNMEIVDDLFNIFENISFQPSLPMLEWADSAELEPLPTELYERALREFRYNSFSLMEEDGEYRHKLKKHLANQATMDHKTKRFMNEMKALSHGLPCTAPNSIFVVADSTRMDLLKALISGPSDSPYAHGLFMFDVLCPEEYPHNPPKVNIVTTGNGSVRFNPNLYSDGFVCLSIINTWDGDPEERWNGARSNLLQVLVSIQALVMDNHVIQKEPGYEDYEVGYLGNVVYSNIVRYGTLKYAMLDWLTNTPPEFKEVILQHFTLKKKDILRTVKNWLDTAREERLDYSTLDPLLKDHNRKLVREFRSEGYYKMLEEVAIELKTQLDRLPDINSESDLEVLSQFVRETVCNYQYHPLPSAENSGDHSAASEEDEVNIEESDEQEQAKVEEFYNHFIDKVLQRHVDLVNISVSHAYAAMPDAPFEGSFDKELERLSGSFYLDQQSCVFVQLSEARKNLWRIVCSVEMESCMNNGFLVFDAFVSDEGLQAIRLLNFRGMKLYSFIDHSGEINLSKISKSKHLSVDRVLSRIFRIFNKEERKASLGTQLLLCTLNMKFCMIEMVQNPWPNLEFARDLLQSKKEIIAEDISRIFEMMDEEGDGTGLKREILADNPQLIEEIAKRGTLKECFQETYGMLISTLNS